MENKFRFKSYKEVEFLSEFNNIVKRMPEVGGWKYNKETDSDNMEYTIITINPTIIERMKLSEISILKRV